MTSREHFLCKVAGCGAALRLVETAPGDRGEGESTECFLCTACGEPHFRLAAASWEEFSYEREQRHVHRVSTFLGKGEERPPVEQGSPGRPPAGTPGGARPRPAGGGGGRR